MLFLFIRQFGYPHILCLNLLTMCSTKKDQNKSKSFNLKVMHWINRIAITVFVLGLFWKILDWFVFN